MQDENVKKLPPLRHSVKVRIIVDANDRDEAALKVARIMSLTMGMVSEAKAWQMGVEAAETYPQTPDAFEYITYINQ